MVKNAFKDKDLRNKFDISSANSINVGRWLPQIIYYFILFKELKKRRIEKNISVSKVKVQMKLSEIDNVEDMEEITSEISRCANTQNKVDSADFSSNHKFHNDIEKISKLFRKQNHSAY